MRQRYKLMTVLFFGVIFSNGLFAQKQYVDDVLEIVETHSIKRDSVDFEKVRKEAYARLNGVKSIEDCYPIIRFILSELNDHHSFLMEKSQVDKWRSTSKSSAPEQPPFFGKLLNDEIGYIQMQGFNSGDSIAIQEYARQLQNLITSIDSNNIKGWILDLRQNTGGNCWPMIAGLGPLLGNGICGYFVDNKNSKSAWFYKDGEAGVNSVSLCTISNSHYRLIQEENPIAVLTGAWTASSGEVVVVSFRGKTNTKSFGERTAGLSTGNSDYTLDDGSMIFLTTSVYADRNGNTYGGKIKPDVVEKLEYNKIDLDTDSLIMRAIDWIESFK